MSDIWFADDGSGTPLVMLHPGGTDSRALDPLVAELTDDYRVIRPEQRGHGRTPDRTGEWHFSDMALETAQLLESLSISQAHVMGWSDGAIVGAYLALSRPDLVASLVFGGAPFSVEGWRDGVVADALPDFMARAYAELSPDTLDHWPIVVAKSARMHRNEPDIDESELKRLTMPTLVVLGDDDEVRFDHAVRMLEALPDGELAILPRTTHGLIVEKPSLLARLIREFHASDKNNGVAPIRRIDRHAPQKDA